MNNEKIKELITRRRKQIVLHSCVYYRLNNNIISDFQYDKWSHELIELQNKYPELAAQCIYSKEFKDFADGGSGFNLPISHPYIVALAERLLKYHTEMKGY